VKELLPKSVAVLGDGTNKFNMQTPLTVALQAYNESPLLKERKARNLVSCVDGKRILEKRNELSKDESLKQTSILINQKCKYNNMEGRNVRSPLHRLNSTVKKVGENM
jgi:hypothetical protein